MTKPTTFTVETEKDKETLKRHIDNRKLGFTATITDGVKRSTEQNRLQRLWISELTQQSKESGITSEEWRAYIKLHIGVPLLREQNEAFRIGYDKTVKPLPYETKMQLMQEPISLPVTSLMTVKQKKQYLDLVYQKMTEKGFKLTDPNWQGWDNIN